MGKNKNWFVLVLFLWIGYSVSGQPLLREKLVTAAETQLHVREKTGKNDGAEIERYLKVSGLGKGFAWCAAYMAWSHKEAGIKAPTSAYSPDWFKTNVVYRSNNPKVTPFESAPGQVFGIYFEAKKRVAHVGMITGETKLSYITIEGNTNNGGSRDGDGVYKRIRNKRGIYVISDYCVPSVKK